jgi:hydroxyethylthiazole kinase-like uncharacterized protein yjeF
MKLAKAAEMRGLDSRAIEEYGIPGVVLMENAGRATVEAIGRWHGPLAGQMAAIVVGPGNNGGDGLVIARHLHQAGAQVEVLALVQPESFSGDAAINWHIVQKLGVKVIQVLSEEEAGVCRGDLGRAALVVDAIFGTGLKRQVEGHFATMIELMNRSGRPIVAVDIPSGLDSDSGQPLGACVRADFTVTYGLAKVGQFIQPGAGYVGRLEVVDIGIPPKIVSEAGIKTELLERGNLARLLPSRHSNSHKGTFGHLLVLAGSQGKTGAALLAAHGALRSGVGLVSLGVPQLLNPIFEASLMEAMTVPLASDYFLGSDDYAAIARAVQGKDALVLGPGLGTEPETVELVAQLYRVVGVPMVVDADALNGLGASLPVLGAQGARVLTPHPGEMARLTGLSTREIQADRGAVAAAYAKEKGAVVLLKGAATVIAAPDGRVAINPTGNPGMATGGMGDVLSGVIGALLAQGMAPWDAACLGAFVHGLAADRLARTRARGGYLASEVAAELAVAFEEIASGE